jgi:hypothetical protein
LGALANFSASRQTHRILVDGGAHCHQ